MESGDLDVGVGAAGTSLVEEEDPAFTGGSGPAGGE
jgi:hypothetical protein